MPELYARTGLEVVREKQTEGIRLVYGAHDYGSASNVSPWPRAIMYLNYNSVDNPPTGGNQRAWFHNNPDPSPLEFGTDSALSG